MQMIALGDVVLFQNHRAISDRPYGCGGGAAEIATPVCALARNDMRFRRVRGRYGGRLVSAPTGAEGWQNMKQR